MEKEFKFERLLCVSAVNLACMYGVSVPTLRKYLRRVGYVGLGGQPYDALRKATHYFVWDRVHEALSRAKIDSKVLEGSTPKPSRKECIRLWVKVRQETKKSQALRKVLKKSGLSVGEVISIAQHVLN